MFLRLSGVNLLKVSLEGHAEGLRVNFGYFRNVYDVHMSSRSSVVKIIFSTAETLPKTCKMAAAGYCISRETSDKEPPLRECDSMISSFKSWTSSLCK